MSGPLRVTVRQPAQPMQVTATLPDTVKVKVGLGSPSGGGGGGYTFKETVWQNLVSTDPTTGDFNDNYIRWPASPSAAWTTAVSGTHLMPQRNGIYTIRVTSGQLIVIPEVDWPWSLGPPVYYDVSLYPAVGAGQALQSYHPATPQWIGGSQIKGWVLGMQETYLQPDMAELSVMVGWPPATLRPPNPPTSLPLRIGHQVLINFLGDPP